MAVTFDMYNMGVGWSNWTETFKTGDAAIVDGPSSVSITATLDNSQTDNEYGLFSIDGWDGMKASVVIHGTPHTLSIDTSSLTGILKAYFATVCYSENDFENYVGIGLETEGSVVVGYDTVSGVETTVDVVITRIWLESPTGPTPTIGTKYALPAFKVSV